MKTNCLACCVALFVFLTPVMVTGLQVEKEHGSETPAYIGELQELAKLRDRGIITETEFERKKAQLLGLDSSVAPPPESGIMTAEEIIQKHCSEVLIAAMKSPSSTKVISTSIVDSVALPRPLHRNVLEGQDPNAPGKTVVIKYDSANSYGAMLRGTIACDYTEPFVSNEHLDLALRSLFIDDEMVSTVEAQLLSIRGITKVTLDILRYQGVLGHSETGESKPEVEN